MKRAAQTSSSCQRGCDVAYIQKTPGQGEGDTDIPQRGGKQIQTCGAEHYVQIVVFQKIQRKKAGTCLFFFFPGQVGGEIHMIEFQIGP